MLGFARSILETGERARQYVEGSKIRGRLRFGVPEDFVLSGLPDILREFTRIHPLIDLELTVDVSGTLYQRLDDGELDLVFAKRPTTLDVGSLEMRLGDRKSTRLNSSH